MFAQLLSFNRKTAYSYPNIPKLAAFWLRYNQNSSSSKRPEISSNWGKCSNCSYSYANVHRNVIAAFSFGSVFLVSKPKKTYRQLLSDPWHIVNFRQKMRAWTPRIQSFWEVTDSQGPFKPLWCSQQTQIPTKFGSNGKQLTWTG